jgi:hypothetical protein
MESTTDERPQKTFGGCLLQTRICQTAGFCGAEMQGERAPQLSLESCRLSAKWTIKHRSGQLEVVFAWIFCLGTEEAGFWA